MQFIINLMNSDTYNRGIREIQTKANNIVTKLVQLKSITEEEQTL